MPLVDAGRRAAYQAEYRLRYEDENRDRIAQRKAAYYKANRERILARNRAWAEANPEKSNVRARRHREANPGKAAEATARWREKNPELVRRRQAEYQARRRARVLASQVTEIVPSLLVAKVAYWGNRCWMCHGEWDSIDHVKPIAKGGAHILANLRPACRSCNARKKAAWNGPQDLHGGFRDAVG